MTLLNLSAGKVLINVYDTSQVNTCIKFTPIVSTLEKLWWYHNAEAEKRSVTSGSHILKYASQSVSAWVNALRGETVIWNGKC